MGYKSTGITYILKTLKITRIKKLGIWSETEPIEPWIFEENKNLPNSAYSIF